MARVVPEQPTGGGKDVRGVEFRNDVVERRIEVSLEDVGAVFEPAVAGLAARRFIGIGRITHRSSSSSIIHVIVVIAVVVKKKFLVVVVVVAIVGSIGRKIRVHAHHVLKVFQVDQVDIAAERGGPADEAVLVRVLRRECFGRSIAIAQAPRQPSGGLLVPMVPGMVRKCSLVDHETVGIGRGAVVVVDVGGDRVCHLYSYVVLAPEKVLRFEEHGQRHELVPDPGIPYEHQGLVGQAALVSLVVVVPDVPGGPGFSSHVPGNVGVVQAPVLGHHIVFTAALVLQFVVHNVRLRLRLRVRVSGWVFKSIAYSTRK
mmetsp:Transcript_22702/g.49380  ORF Transcript_22702/g.49380 Transcript_22702/m.49380 type:complete len:315 (+) Transcript_22702:560-1504(+)